MLLFSHQVIEQQKTSLSISYLWREMIDIAALALAFYVPYFRLMSKINQELDQKIDYFLARKEK